MTFSLAKSAYKCSHVPGHIFQCPDAGDNRTTPMPAARVFVFWAWIPVSYKPRAQFFKNFCKKVHFYQTTAPRPLPVKHQPPGGTIRFLRRINPGTEPFQ